MNSKPTASPSPQPAGYSSTDSAEIEAINILRATLDPNRVKSDLKERDKHPNIDGYLELVNDFGKPLGKLEVQVKKIPPGARHYQCPVSLFAYTKSTALPVVLICVDTKEKTVFWKHLKYEDLLGKESQDSISVSFEKPEDVIHADGSYYNRWLSIAQDYCDRIHMFDVLRRIAIAASPLIGYQSDEIKRIQIFTDELNSLLDRTYACLKRVLFPGVWKIGFALQGWTDEYIQYALFAIEEGRNDPLIKQIDSRLDLFRDPNIGFYSYSGENHLSRDAKSAARRFVFDRMGDLIKADGLSLRTDFIAREYLFNFIDRHRDCLGLDISDKYEGLEIYHAFHEYLPRWCDAARTSISYPQHIPYFDPGLARRMI